ncbi:MAG: hypothetical protein ACKOWQ_08485, partial [Aquirufa sp.]
MLVLLSLGFVFITTLLFTSYTNKTKFAVNKSKVLIVFVSLLRSLLITSLVYAALGGAFLSSSAKLNESVLLLIDNSTSMRTGGIEKAKREFQDLIQIIKQKHPNQNILIYSLSGKLLLEENINFDEAQSTVSNVSKIIFNISQKSSLASIYLFSDAQLENIEDILNAPYHIVLIPFGKIEAKKQLEVDVPRKTIISVPNEEIQIPLSLEMGDAFNQQRIMSEIYIDKKLTATIKTNINSKEPYQNLHFSVKSNKLGLHQVQIIVKDPSGQQFKNISWQVVKEKAVVDAYASSPHPDLGVINRIAKSMHITLNWNFTNKPNFTGKNILLYGNFGQKLNTQDNLRVLEINTSKEKNVAPFQHNGYDLWKLQMNENVEWGRTTKIDSIVRTWLTEVSRTAPISARPRPTHRPRTRRCQSSP